MRNLCTALLVALLGAPAHAEEPAQTVLRMAAIAPEGTGWAREIRAMSRDIEAATHGAVTMKWYLGGIAGDEEQALDRIRRGQLDGAAGALFCGSLSPTVRMTRIAGLVQNRDEALHLIHHFIPRIDEDFKKNGFVNLVVGTFGTDVILLRDRVDSFAQLRKQPVWVWDADVILRRQMGLMGMTIVPGGVQQLGAMYDDKKIDGMYVIPTAALAFQWTTRARWYVDVNGSMLAGCVTVSQKTYDALSFEQQQALKAVASKFALRFEDLGKREDALLFGGMLDKQGVHRLPASDALRSAFLEAALAARGRIDEQTVPKSLVKEAFDTVAEFRAAHRKTH